MGSQCVQISVDLKHICTSAVNFFLCYTICWISKCLWKLIWRICLSVWLIQKEAVQKHNEKESLFCLITFVPYVHLLSWNGDCIRISSLLYRIVWNCVKGFWQVLVVTVELGAQLYISCCFFHFFARNFQNDWSIFCFRNVDCKALVTAVHEVLRNSKWFLWNLMVEQNHRAKCQEWGTDIK